MVNDTPPPADDRPSDEAVAAATAYEELLVPALFARWAPRVVAAARIRPGHRVLDVACGTGILARTAAPVVGAGGSVAGIDASPGMVAVAERLDPSSAWRTGSAEALPYGDGAFDAVVSQFGLMFFSDRPGALRDMIRVLAPGGTLAVAVWASLETMDAFADEVAAVERVAGRPAADALRAPFGLGDRTALAALFERAGARSIEVDTQWDEARFPGIRALVEADLRGWLPVMGVSLPEDQIARTLAEAERALARYRASDGTLQFDVSAHLVTTRN